LQLEGIMKIFVRAVAVAAVAASLSACASITQGTTQSIAISTPPVTGAQCALNSSQGNWVVTSPGIATVKKSRSDIEVRCNKEGYQDAAAVIPSDFEGWTVGNVIFGGIIGLGVDAATGAMNEYPNTFQVPMVPAGQQAPQAPGQPIS
jgi:hypothetical protein